MYIKKHRMGVNELTFKIAGIKNNIIYIFIISYIIMNLERYINSKIDYLNLVGGVKRKGKKKREKKDKGGKKEKEKKKEKDKGKGDKKKYKIENKNKRKKKKYDGFKLDDLGLDFGTKKYDEYHYNNNEDGCNPK